MALAPDIVEQLRKLHRSGSSAAAAARKLDLGKTTAQRWFLKFMNDESTAVNSNGRELIRNGKWLVPIEDRPPDWRNIFDDSAMQTQVALHNTVNVQINEQPKAESAAGAPENIPTIPTEHSVKEILLESGGCVRLSFDSINMLNLSDADWEFLSTVRGIINGYEKFCEGYNKEPSDA